MVAANDLLTELRRRGVELRADGDRLRYRPKDAVSAELLEQVKAHKAEVLAALLTADPDITWRIAAMRPQVPMRGPLPFLTARPTGLHGEGGCLSCGDTLGPENRYRCVACARAAEFVLNEVREQVRGGSP